jgi:hypothetical protein
MLFAKEYFKKNLVFLFVCWLVILLCFLRLDMPEYFYQNSEG